MPLAPQPGVGVHAGKAVAGGGELALEGLAPHLPVVDYREAESLLHRHDLADRTVLSRLELSRRQLTPRVGLTGIAQELRPQQAPHVLNPRIHRHNPQRATPPPLVHSLGMHPESGLGGTVRFSTVRHAVTSVAAGERRRSAGRPGPVIRYPPAPEGPHRLSTTALPPP